MSADIVNLRRARKTRARAAAADAAAENRVRFGRTLTERRATTLADAAADRHLEGHRLTRSSASDDS